MKQALPKLLWMMIFFITVLPSSAQNKSLFEKQLFILGEDTLPCRILTPQGFESGKKYPLVIFLHGAGERGNDNEAQLTWGAELFLDSANRTNFPAIVVFPQCPKNQRWSDYTKKITDEKADLPVWTEGEMTRPLLLVSSFIDTLMNSGSIDRRRVYLGGLSMGGYGSFELLWRKPNLFAAALPICGGGNPAMISGYRNDLPLWIFHGDKDNVIPAANSRMIVNLLSPKNKKVKYTEYPGVGHDSWKNAFQEKELLPWLFAQRLPSKYK
ncbi:MAG: alpha/beta hydrolase-fold protein [Chitinophagia bacterium]|jgi:predicted peptidase